LALWKRLEAREEQAPSRLRTWWNPSHRWCFLILEQALQKI
jgi:hypothetical protein